MRQEMALDILKAGRNAFLTGPAGSGKTHVLRRYIAYLKERGVSVALTASTGIAATHIGGMTIHSWSGIGVKEELGEGDIETLVQKERLWKRFDKTKVLVIDEVSMLAPAFFDSLDRLARAMKRTEAPFGGVQVVLSGDFFQLPPVVKGEQDVQFVHASDAWRAMDVRVCYLEEQHRHERGEALAGILGEIRSGTLSGASRARLLGRRARDASSTTTPARPDSSKGAGGPARLFTHNRDVDALNKRELAKLPGTPRTYEMKSRGRANLVEALKRGVLAPETLVLKEDAKVMFVKNNFDRGYVNGTLGTVEAIEDGPPVVRTFGGTRIEVEPEEWSIEEDGKVLASVAQLPLRLAWAITVHKSQGMTLDAAEVDLSQAFVPGQGYVALSRVRNLTGLVLTGANDTAFAVDGDVAQFDEHLRRKSAEWEQVVAGFSKRELEEMHKKFITACGGTLNAAEMRKNRARGRERVEEKIPTHRKTEALLSEELSLAEIAARRGLALGTIISHLEKLRAEGAALPEERLKPKEADLQKMHAAFRAVKDAKLSPVYKKLGGTYTFEELRLARLFL